MVVMGMIEMKGVNDNLVKPQGRIITSKDLITLDARSNHINGPIPSTVGNCTKLEYLLLNDNALSGSIPSNLGRCTQLKELLLNDNALSGSILSDLGKLSSLEQWDVSHNKLTGTLPESLGQLSKLEKFRIYNNLMEGKLSSLEHWDVPHNKLIGTLPESLWQLSKLEVLRIDNNLIEGIVSESHLDNLTALTYFDASGNSLTLRVSANWIPRVQFETLGFGSWKLGLQFPTWIQSQKFLWNLNLSFIGISDTVSPWLFNSSLQYIDLSYNQLCGKSSKISEIVKVLYIVKWPTHLDISNNLMEAQSFIARYSSSILMNPPLPDDLSFRQWYSLNKEEIRNLLDAKTYNDPNCLLPPPNEEDIKTISNFQASFPVGFGIDTELNDSLKKYTVVCFLKTYESPFQGQLQRINIVIKAYTATKLSHNPLPLAFPENIEVSSTLGTSSATHAKKSSKDQMFTSTTKLVLEEIVAAISYKESQTSTNSGVKRSLEFLESAS
ncbi:receptor-like protein kinase 2 [Coffea eugenioides]|uniref:receptor-like protein kinase 2 n=1 Tax=Coffea eugenioides TaxID=49369 RepID=UPI000F614B7C|nr:receptor-like protein kinase 2 [Coffea eugenioides]